MDEKSKSGAQALSAPRTLFIVDVESGMMKRGSMMGLLNTTTVYINPTTTTRFNPDGKGDKARFNYDGTDARQTIFGFLSSIKFVPSASETSPPPSDTSLGNRDEIN